MANGEEDIHKGNITPLAGDAAVAARCIGAQIVVSHHGNE